MRWFRGEIAGERFAMISGTSMATPHVAGLSALLKAKYPSWSPAALSSALATTADILDRQGRPIQSQQLSGGAAPLLQDATPFEMGGGALNINAAKNPGLIFDAGQSTISTLLRLSNQWDNGYLLLLLDLLIHCLHILLNWHDKKS